MRKIVVEALSHPPQTANGQTRLTPFAGSREQVVAGLAVVDLQVRWAIMRARAHGLSPDDAFRGLYIGESKVDGLLAQELGHSLWPRLDETAVPFLQWQQAIDQAQESWQARTAASRVPLCLEQLRQAFNLTPADISLLLLALAPELDARYERLFAYLQDDVTKKRPSVELCLHLSQAGLDQRLDERARFADEAPLFRHRLLVRYADKNRNDTSLLAQFVRPVPTLVEHLLGRTRMDSRLQAYTRLWQPHDWSPPAALPAVRPDHLVKAARQGAIFSFRGGYGAGKRTVACYMAHQLQRPLLDVDMAALAQGDDDLVEMGRLLDRDGRFYNALLYLRNWDGLLHDNHPPPPFFRLLLNYPGPIVMAGEQSWQPRGERARPLVRVQFEAPAYDGRLRAWQHHLAESDLDPTRVANHFRFSPGQIADAVATAHDLALGNGRPLSEEDLFAASRAHSNQNLANMATKVKPCYGWDDIVLPADTFNQLQEMVNVVQQRHIVYEQWGFGRKMALGKGLNVLFSGEPGTGKTMAADIIAGALGLDLYKVDLSTLVSKYIGETEKNLERIFTEAATSNAILFFDEADAIFGKRSEVKDSHDRYANIEISFLLQRMEAYDGVVILATNLQANLDEAFTRRFHFITDFPFPDAADRERIWRVNLPAETPHAAEVDFGLLARRFRITGGNIRNIILAAAFLAARDEQPMSMSHLFHAARREFQKMGRLIEETLFTEA
jgi:hypothetical protein